MRTNCINKIISALFLLSCTTILGQTTTEEYNYITKGYQVQMESGLDMKKGYSLEDLGTETTTERSAELKVLHRINGERKVIAAYMIIYRRSGLPTEFICIPSPNSEVSILNKYWAELYNGNGDSSQRLQLISFLISKKLKW
jgi:hypothetical protein